MGNYRQHLTFATGLGVVYAAAATVAGGVHWIYGSVAALLSALGGLLPDLDSPTGFGLKGFTGIVGVLAAAAVWRGLARLDPPPAFEFHLWAMIATYALVRHGLRRVISRIAVHRGMCHSFPTCGICGAATYLAYPSSDHSLRMMMAVAVMIGVGSHLLLDEICSVDLVGARVNKAFGTAMKLWAPSAWSTLAAYGLLSWLTYQVVQVWPEDPFQFRTPEPPNVPLAARIRTLQEVGRSVAAHPEVQAKVEQLNRAAPSLAEAVKQAVPAIDAPRPNSQPNQGLPPGPIGRVADASRKVEAIAARPIGPVNLPTRRDVVPLAPRKTTAPPSQAPATPLPRLTPSGQARPRTPNPPTPANLRSTLPLARPPAAPVGRGTTAPATNPGRR
ncbi:MAG: metal-dependent hydrolase [Isosphaeraceae bacterium]